MVEGATVDMKFSSKFNLKVTLRKEYLSRQPFTLKSRHGIALVFAFWGDSDKVSEFMQKTSHKTRSYYVNANELKGFVVSISIMELLKRAEAEKELVEATKHQHVDMQALLEKLESLKTNKERIDYLGLWCPSLCIFVLQECGMTK